MSCDYSVFGVLDSIEKAVRTAKGVRRTVPRIVFLRHTPYPV